MSATRIEVCVRLTCLGRNDAENEAENPVDKVTNNFKDTGRWFARFHDPFVAIENVFAYGIEKELEVAGVHKEQLDDQLTAITDSWWVAGASLRRRHR